MQDSKARGGSLGSIWLFDPASLIPGDVVLERGRSLKSNVIRLFDWGNYSHALIWLGGTDFLEAVGTGVRVISYARLLIQNPEDWMVLRQSDPAAGLRAANAARAFAHKEYDLIGAVGTKVPGDWKANATAMFCSQLVATAYLNAGVPLVAKANKVGPNGLRKKSMLEPVTPVPLVKRQLSDEDAAAAAQLIDRDRAYADTAMAREMRISQEVFTLVRGLFPPLQEPAKFGLSNAPGNLGDVFKLLAFCDQASALKISAELLPALESRGYFDLIDGELRDLIGRLKLQNGKLAAGLLNKGEIIELGRHYETTIVSHIKAADHHKSNADAYQQLHGRRFPLPIYDRLHRMHRSLQVLFTLIVKEEQKLLAGCLEVLKAADP